MRENSTHITLVLIFPSIVMKILAFAAGQTPFRALALPHQPDFVYG